MKIAKKNEQSGDGFSRGPSGGITKENYRDRCAAFIKGRGGIGFVIRAIEGSDGSLASHLPVTEAQWIAWMEYFAEKEIPHAYALSRGMTTVPAEWPEEFDYEAVGSNREARLRAPRVVHPADRAEMSRRFAELCEAVTVRGRRAKVFGVHEMSPAMAAAHLAEVERRSKTTPMALSPDAFRSLGFVAPPAAPAHEAAE